MPRSSRTTQEFETAAMLLGLDWSYDWMDHTFVGPYKDANLNVYDFPILDADTMAPVEAGEEVAQRVQQVQKGLLGPSDAYPQQKGHDQVPLHGQDDPQTTAATCGDTS